MKRFLFLLVLVAPLVGCSSTYAKPGVSASVGLGEYGAVPSEAPEAQPEAPLPAAPAADAAPEVKTAYAELQARDALRSQSTDSALLQQIDTALWTLESDETLPPEQKASLASDLLARKRELEASMGEKRVTLPQDPTNPLEWLYALLAIGTGVGGSVIATRKAKAALRAFDLAKYRGVVNGAAVEVSEAQVVAAVASTLGTLPTAPNGIAVADVPSAV